MWARVARFEGDPETLDERIEGLRAKLLTGDLLPELALARQLVLVDRDTGVVIGVNLFDSEEVMHKVDEPLSEGFSTAGSRTSVEFYEVPLHSLQGSTHMF